MTRTTLFSALLIAVLAPNFAQAAMSFKFVSRSDNADLGGREITILPSPLPANGEVDIDIVIKSTSVWVFADGEFFAEKPYEYNGRIKITFMGYFNETRPYNVTFWGQNEPSRFAIRAAGGKGHDSFRNRTNNPSWFYGREGMDELIGGSGPDILIGGADDDILVAGRGNDFLFGDLSDSVDGWMSGFGWFAEEYVWRRMINFDENVLGFVQEVHFDDDGGDDILIGEDGDDYLDPGYDGEPDLCTGGQGADIFVQSYKPPGEVNNKPTDLSKSDGDSIVKMQGVGGM